LDGYGADGKALVVIRFKNIKSFEFLIEDRQRLELLRFDHLGFKPVFHFILPFVLEVLVDIVKVPIQLEKCHHFLVADGAHEPGTCSRGRCTSWPFSIFQRDPRGQVLSV